MNGLVVIPDDSTSCGEATGVAADVVTGKRAKMVQEVDGWTCQFGNAMVRPTVYVCSQADRSFEAREAG